jgi:hypothetical protein
MEVGANAANRPRRVRARDRDRTALQLRATGLTFGAIGAQLGVSDEAARKAVNRASDAVRTEIAEGADRLRALEAERLDRAAAALASKVEGGDLRAQEVWLKNRARYAALLGLDLRPTPDALGAPTFVLTGTARAIDAPAGALLLDNRLPWDKGGDGAPTPDTGRGSQARLALPSGS